MDMDVFDFLLGAFVVLLVYLVPSFVAFGRRHPNRWVILLLNFLLGGTGIVWFGCLIWAFLAVHRTNDPNATHGGESGLNLAANDIVRMRVEPPVLPPPLPLPLKTTDVVERLERLKMLRDEGIVDSDQFEQLKKQLIAPI